MCVLLTFSHYNKLKYLEFPLESSDMSSSVPFQHHKKAESNRLVVTKDKEERHRPYNAFNVMDGFCTVSYRASTACISDLLGQLQQKIAEFPKKADSEKG